MFPVSHRKIKYITGKSIKNYYNTCRELFIWLTSARDNLGQRGSNYADMRNPLWAIWRLPRTWRRVLRTMFHDFPWFSENGSVFQCFPWSHRKTWGTPSGRGRHLGHSLWQRERGAKHSPPGATRSLDDIMHFICFMIVIWFLDDLRMILRWFREHQFSKVSHDFPKWSGIPEVPGVAQEN